MQKNDARQYIIDTLRDYKRLIALKNELECDFDGYLTAVRIDGMPKGSGVSEPIETVIKRKRLEIKEVNRQIKRVNGWLAYLDDRERHYLTEIYIHNRFKTQAQNKWYTDTKEYIGRKTWLNTHTSGINKIRKLMLDMDKKKPLI